VVSTSGTKVGGLIGNHQAGQTIVDVSATGTVSSDGDDVGGLVGFTRASVRNATASGEVESTTGANVGGLVGRLSHDDSTHVTNVTATGTVSAGADHVGGLVGFIEDSDDNGNITMSGARATGDIEMTSDDGGPASVGGLVGRFEHGSAITDVSATGDVSSVGGNEVGGLIGRLDQLASTDVLKNASATGDVTTTGQKVGGLIGFHRTGSVDNSHAQGNVSAGSGDNVGGLIGVHGRNGGRVGDSYARGDVNTSGNNVGGLIGRSEGKVLRVYATGRVEGGSAVGGLVGKNDGGQLSESYWDKGATDKSDATGSDTPATVSGYGSVGDTTPAPQMQGRAATELMEGLNYTTTWNVTRGYPVLQAKSTGTEQLPRTVDTVTATNASAIQSEQVSVSVTVTTTDSNIREDFVISVQDTGGLTSLENATAVTNDTGVATFNITESSPDTYTPTFGVAGYSTATTNATITVDNGAVRTYTREDDTELTAVYRGNGTPDSPYLANSLTDLQAINKNATTRDEHYQLTDDINASATIESWNGGNGFELQTLPAHSMVTGTRSRTCRSTVETKRALVCSATPMLAVALPT